VDIVSTPAGLASGATPAIVMLRGFVLRCFVALPLVLVVLHSGCSQEDSIPPPENPKVSVMRPEKRELIDYEEFNGWLEADKTVEVRARVRGHIQKVHFTDGQIVNAGDLLFDLDPRPFEAEVRRVKDTLRIYQAQLVAAQKEEARLEELVTKGGASQSQVEKAVAVTQSLDAQIAATENEIDRVELDFEYSRIKADIDGRVSRAQLTEGNLVNAGGSDPLLTTIVSIDPIRIYFNIDERSLQRYAHNLGVTGQSLTDLLTKLKDNKAPFTFALDGEAQFTHEGTVLFGDNRIDPTTGTLQIYGIVSNPEGRFLPGARVRVRLPIGKPHAALLVPETAILADQDKRYVLIVDEQNNVRRRDLTLGTLTDDGMRAIQPAQQLDNTERPEDWWVIIDNLQRARVNYPVEPQRRDQGSEL
jgi:RND family efflux transporter MFP subunit